MAKKALPTPELLRKLLRYEPETGRLFWRDRDECRGWDKSREGEIAFTADNGKGYLSGTVSGRTLKAHRVIWAIHYGRWPNGMIDHKNGNRKDNRVVNLRATTARGNARNRSSAGGSSSQYLGVAFEPSRGKWRARIRHNGKLICLGRYSDEKSAASAYDSAALKYHGEFSRLNMGGVDG